MIDGGFIDFGAMVVTITSICIVANHVYNRWFGIDRKISVLYELVTAHMIVNMNTQKNFSNDLKKWQPRAYSILMRQIKKQNGNGNNRRS